MTDARPATGSGFAEQDGRVEQHADRHEEQHRERVAQRQGVGGRLVAMSDSLTHHAGQEGAERERHAEDRPSAKAMPSAIASTASVNSSREPVARDAREQPRDEPRAGDDHEDDEAADLAQRHADVDRAAGRRRPASPVPPGAAPAREQHEDEHRQQVLDDQPADRDAALLGVELVAVLERAQQHDRAGDGEREARGPGRRRGPAPERRRAPTPSSVATAIWTSAPGTAIPRTASRSRSEKWMPTPNISRMTPISASSAASRSATKPGVKGPMATPASDVADDRGQAAVAGRPGRR